MALGASVPEVRALRTPPAPILLRVPPVRFFISMPPTPRDRQILLSVIELLGNGMYSGDLGPSTIVGSAAFNLLVIVGICVMAIPEGQVRAQRPRNGRHCRHSFA